MSLGESENGICCCWPDDTSDLMRGFFCLMPSEGLEVWPDLITSADCAG